MLNEHTLDQLRGLRLDGMRRWSAMLSGRGGQRHRRAAAPNKAEPATPAQPGTAFLPIPIHQSSRSTQVLGGVEVMPGDGVRVTLMGVAAQRVLDAVLARLQTPRCSCPRQYRRSSARIRST